MSKINDIFDLPEQTPPTKERKKVIMTDEKKNALLERLAKGRETRANNLLAKKGITKPEELKEPVKDKRIESLKIETKIDKSEEERKAFINTMVGKSKPVEKFERPKKKIISENLETPKVEAHKQSLVVEAPKVMAPVVMAPKVVAPAVMAPKIIAPPKIVAPVVFSTLKKPMWA